MNSLGVTRINFEFTIYFVNSVWIKYLLREFTTYSLSLSWYHQDLTWFFTNSLWIHFRLREFAIFVAKMPWIYSVSRLYYEFIVCFAYSLWIRYRLREFTMNSLLIHLVFQEFAINLLVVLGFTLNFPSSRINYEFTLFIAD